MALTQVSPGLLNAEAQAQGFRNRIINGDMRIDQRNAGASVTPANFAYLTDRWQFRASQGSKFTAEQTISGVAAPVGFTDYLGMTSTSAYSVGAGEQFGVRQFIEGLNISDLAWGTANAKAVTLSFWVRSSLTGTHSGALGNSGDARAYPFSYTISVADTWEYKTITIAGDTSGTWLTTNGIGIKVSFNLGAGSSMLATAGAWTTGEIVGATGSVSVVGTSGATFYITGVQLEVGSVATEFERRPYQTEANLCYRYYYKSTAFTNYAPVGVGRAWGSGNGNAPFYLPAPMRSNPTITYSSLTHFDVVTLGNPTAIQNDGAAQNCVKVGWAKAATSGNFYQFEYGNSGTAAWLGFESEL